MTRSVYFEPEAASELLDAEDWYERRVDGLGMTFVTAVNTAVDSIALWPHTGAIVEGAPRPAEVRRAPIDRFPYYVAYVVTDDAIQVLAIAHERRHPTYWTGT